MTPQRALFPLLAVGLALGVPCPPWSAALRAEPLRAAISRSGVLGGADYLIEVPLNWRGGLVVFAHGIQRGQGPGTVVAPPITSHIVAQGHAWIASGYRACEYQPHLFIEDLVALRELFLNEVGRPRWTIIHGQSMGGHIVVARSSSGRVYTRVVSRSAVSSTGSASPTTCSRTPPQPS